MGLFGGGKDSGIKEQQKRLEEERERADKEANKIKKQIKKDENLRKKRALGRPSLLKTPGGELGVEQGLGG